MRVFSFTDEALKRFTDLSGTAQRVYLELLCLRNYKTGLTRVTQQRLASRIGISSRSSISEAITQLEKQKFIFVYDNRVSLQGWHAGLRPFNTYRIININNGVIR